VLLPEHAGNAQAAISRALQALDFARNSRSDRLSLYQPCERRESERRRAVAIADEVVRALNDRRMILALQPIVTSRSHEPELYECLLRMKRLDGSIASASEFIPVAEQFGLAKLVDHRALELAIELLGSMPGIKLALNVSAATDELFVRTLIELARSFGITTVGEWVGDEKTAKLLEKAGVSFMQGYFFGAPELTKPTLPAQSAS
jgi:EAL domain-containing protein (putative c-di-GMP-specific phosphodiesterase class I)